MTTQQHAVGRGRQYNNPMSFGELREILRRVDSRLKAVERSNRMILAKTITTNNRRRLSLLRSIVDCIMILHKKHGRPIAITEIVDFFSGSGSLLLGRNKSDRAHYLAAHLSAEVKRPDTKIRRVSRGFYAPIEVEELEGKNLKF